MRLTFAHALLVAAALLAASCRTKPTTAAAPMASTAAPRAGIDVARLHVLAINGGGRPPQNYQSHLLHVKELLALLGQAGVSPAHVAVFDADGSDPAKDLAVREVQADGDFWLLRGTRLERIGTQVTYADSQVPGVQLQAATKANIAAWLQDAKTRLRPGDTLLLYVTDHGTKDPDDKGDSRITLWGDKETLAVSELRPLLAALDPGVRVVALMSQCFSGGFADLMSPSPDQPPHGNVCGYFSSTADRMAYGCYPENRGRENVGHSFEFLEALRREPRFPRAQLAVLVDDRTPDVPLATSDVFLANLVRRAADKAGEKPTPYLDGLLREAWRDKAAWEPEIRLLDRIGQAFGVFSPRSMTELEDQATRIPQISEQFKGYSNAWKAALGDSAEANLGRFLAAHPDWAKRVADPELAKLDPNAQRALSDDLLRELVPWTRKDRKTHDRLNLLHTKSETASAPTYRMDVRLAVVLRMRAILTDVAGRMYLATRGTPAERAAYESLRACEDLTIGSGAPLPGGTTLAERETFPRFEDDLRVAERVMPAWMGIRFKPLAPNQWSELGLREGAAGVVAVYPGSPAEAAGLAVGDVVTGPPDAPFTEPNMIREWTMLSRVDQPAPLDVVRDKQHIRVTLVPKPFPQQWPELPGPPAIGSVAPPIPVAAFRGTVPPSLAGGTAHLLFFWATWCAPCKASLPEVLAYEAATKTPVIAITDEASEQLTPFFQQFTKPFPQTVAMDDFRKTFLAYGVSGTPTFVLIGGDGTVRAYTTGYSAEKGLGIDGWTWKGRPAAAPH